MVIPIHLPSLTTHIHADRRLVFQVLTAFGSSNGGLGKTSVLQRDGDRMLVEFHTSARDLVGRERTYRTMEWVTPREPDRIDFEGVEGPLDVLRDRFLLEEVGNCTLLIYESQIGIRGWVFGWLIARLVVRPMMKRMMRKHTQEMKETIEARAKRSRLIPLKPCDVEVAELEDAAKR